jgi:hypothetical protein
MSKGMVDVRGSRPAWSLGGTIALIAMILAPSAWAASAAGVLRFTPLAEPFAAAGGDSRAVNWVDYDGDGDLDLYVTNGPKGGADNFLYRNDGAAGFAPVTDSAIVQDGSPSVASAWGDYDNDGDPDLFVATWYGLPNLLYRNDGQGQFVAVSDSPVTADSSYTEAADWGDYDSDGDLDLYVANSAGDKRNFLYRNQGGAFVRLDHGAATADTSASRGVTWVDYDGDGDLDLYVVNENLQANDLYRNDGLDAGFVSVVGHPLTAAGGSSMSASWGDYDNDGDQDVVVTNWGQDNVLYRNDGRGRFTALASAPLAGDRGASFGSGWADADNDGDLDLHIGTAFARSPGDFFYENLGHRLLRRPDLALEGNQDWTYGLAWADYDGDGDLDVFVARTDGRANVLFRNDTAAGHWLGVRLHGPAGGLGTIVRVKASCTGGPARWQVRQAAAAAGYGGQTEGLHFGLGVATVADSVVVVGLRGQRQVWTQVAADQILDLRAVEAHDGGENAATPENG